MYDDDPELPLSYEPRVEPRLLDARDVVQWRASVLLDAARLEELASTMRAEAKEARRLYERAMTRAADVERIALRLAGVEDG